MRLTMKDPPYTGTPIECVHVHADTRRFDVGEDGTKGTVTLRPASFPELGAWDVSSYADDPLMSRQRLKVCTNLKTAFHWVRVYIMDRMH